jgi:hypothetical protein
MISSLVAQAFSRLEELAKYVIDIGEILFVNLDIICPN